MDYTFNSACQSNHEGVSLMKSHDFHKAAEYFSTALSKFKAVLTYCEAHAIYESVPVMEGNHPDQGNMPEHSSSHENEPMVWSGSPNDCLKNVTDAKSEYCKMEPFIEVGGAFLFHCAFEIRRFCLNRRDLCINSTVTCMFNLALTNHLCALQMKSEKGDRLCTAAQKHVHSATRLYELAYKLYIHQDEPNVVDLCLLAIVNNLAHLHKVTNDKRRSDLSFRHLLTMMMVFFQYDEFHYEEFWLDGFMSNVQWLILGNPFFAAAA